jgi:hypothetical protein
MPKYLVTVNWKERTTSALQGPIPSLAHDYKLTVLDANTLIIFQYGTDQI